MCVCMCVACLSAIYFAGKARALEHTRLKRAHTHTRKQTSAAVVVAAL